MAFYNVWVNPFKNVDFPPHAFMVNVKKPLEYSGTLDQGLSDLENVWLEKNKFLAGGEATFADIIGAVELMQIIGLKIYELDAEKYPKVARWLEDVKDFYNPEFDEAHYYVYKMGQQFKGGPPKSIVMLFKASQYFKKLLK